MDSPTPSHSNSVRLITAIYLVGPSSAGKTTLCNALAKALGLPKGVHISEVARTIMRERGFTRDDVVKLEMQKAIMEAQLKEDRSARRYATATGQVCRGIVLSDRSAINPLVYALLKNDAAVAESLATSPNFQAALPDYRKSTFILLHAIPDWMEDDGVRSLEDGSDCFHVFKTVLSELDIQFHELGESCRWLEERVGFVRRCAHI